MRIMCNRGSGRLSGRQAAAQLISFVQQAQAPRQAPALILSPEQTL
jgi:hypothetical protein